MARRPDLVTVYTKKKRTCCIADFAVPADRRMKIKESKKRDKYFDLAREMKKTVEQEGDVDSNFSWCIWDNPQSFDKRTGRLRNKRTSRDHPDYSIIKIGQNTEKNPGDLRRFAVSQTPVANYQLSLVWKKTLKRVNNNTQTWLRKGKSQERNWISFHSSTKQRQKCQLYQNKNR